jgi:hypothetical protein
MPACTVTQQRNGGAGGGQGPVAQAERSAAQARLMEEQLELVWWFAVPGWVCLLGWVSAELLAAHSERWHEVRVMPPPRISSSDPAQRTPVSVLWPLRMCGDRCATSGSQRRAWTTITARQACGEPSGLSRRATGWPSSWSGLSSTRCPGARLPRRCAWWVSSGCSSASAALPTVPTDLTHLPTYLPSHLSVISLSVGLISAQPTSPSRAGRWADQWRWQAWK